MCSYRKMIGFAVNAVGVADLLAPRSRISYDLWSSRPAL